MNKCITILQSIDIHDYPIKFESVYIEPESGNKIPLHRVAYFYLRQVIVHLIEDRQKLSLCPQPLNTYQWTPEVQKETCSDLLSIHELDLDVDEYLDIGIIDQNCGSDTENE